MQLQFQALRQYRPQTLISVSQRLWTNLPWLPQNAQSSFGRKSGWALFPYPHARCANTYFPFDVRETFFPYLPSMRTHFRTRVYGVLRLLRPVPFLEELQERLYCDSPVAFSSSPGQLLSRRWPFCRTLFYQSKFFILGLDFLFADFLLSYPISSSKIYYIIKINRTAMV